MELPLFFRRYVIVETLAGTDVHLVEEFPLTEVLQGFREHDFVLQDRPAVALAAFVATQLVFVCQMANQILIVVLNGIYLQRVVASVLGTATDN